MTKRHVLCRLRLVKISLSYDFYFHRETPEENEVQFKFKSRNSLRRIRISLKR